MVNQCVASFLVVIVLVAALTIATDPNGKKNEEFRFIEILNIKTVPHSFDSRLPENCSTEWVGRQGTTRSKFGSTTGECDSYRHPSYGFC